MVACKLGNCLPCMHSLTPDAQGGKFDLAQDLCHKCLKYNKSCSKVRMELHGGCMGPGLRLWWGKMRLCVPFEGA